jgi:hypothetical protein
VGQIAWDRVELTAEAAEPIRAIPIQEGQRVISGPLLALTHFLRLIRGIMLRGAAPRELGTELHALAIFTAVTLTLATLRFRKRLD